MKRILYLNNQLSLKLGMERCGAPQHRIAPHKNAKNTAPQHRTALNENTAHRAPQKFLRKTPHRKHRTLSFNTARCTPHTQI
jgi:hypothetical protein